MRAEERNLSQAPAKKNSWWPSLFKVKFAGRRLRTFVAGDRHFDTILEAEDGKGTLMLGIDRKLLDPASRESLPNPAFVQIRLDDELAKHDHRNQFDEEKCLTHIVRIIDDTPFLQEDFLEILEAIKFIDKNRENGQHVYVHCRVGIGRSPSLILCYLMSICGKNFEDAFHIIKRERDQISPSPEQTLSAIQFNLWYQIQQLKSGDDINPLMLAFNDFYVACSGEFNRVLKESYKNPFKVQGKKNGILYKRNAFEYVFENIAFLIQAEIFILNKKKSYYENEANEFYKKLLASFRKLATLCGYYNIIKKDDIKIWEDFKTLNKKLDDAIQNNPEIRAHEIEKARQELIQISQISITEFDDYCKRHPSGNIETVQNWKKEFSSAIDHLNKLANEEPTLDKIENIRCSMLNSLQNEENQKLPNILMRILYKVIRWLQDIFNIGNASRELNARIRESLEDFPFRCATGQFNHLNSIFSEPLPEKRNQKENEDEIHDNNQAPESDTQGENTSDFSDTGSNYGR